MADHDGLTIDASEHEDTYVVRISGELDLNVTAALRDALAEAERSDAGEILLDIDGLDFIDSTGMQAIVQAARASAEGSDRLRLTRGKGHVAAMFRLTALDRTLPFVGGPRASEPVVAPGR